MSAGLPEGDRVTALLRFQKAMRDFSRVHQGESGPLSPEQTIPLIEAACQQFSASAQVRAAAAEATAFLGALVAGKGGSKQSPAKVSSRALGDFAAWLAEHVSGQQPH